MTGPESINIAITTTVIALLFLVLARMSSGDELIIYRDFVLAGFFTSTTAGIGFAFYSL